MFQLAKYSLRSTVFLYMHNAPKKSHLGFLTSAKILAFNFIQHYQGRCQLSMLVPPPCWPQRIYHTSFPSSHFSPSPHSHKLCLQHISSPRQVVPFWSAPPAEADTASQEEPHPEANTVTHLNTIKRCSPTAARYFKRPANTG